MSDLMFGNLLLWLGCIALILLGVANLAEGVTSMMKTQRRRAAFSNQAAINLFLGTICFIAGFWLLLDVIKLN